MRKFKYKIGDKVRVTRIAASQENGWENSWPDIMDRCVGHVFEVTYVYGKSGIQLDTKDMTGSMYGFPEFVLEPEIKIGEQLEFDFMKG